MFSPTLRAFALGLALGLLATAAGADDKEEKRIELKVGDLADFKFEHLFLGNPVWEKPVIQEGPGRYFCCLPQLFSAFAFHIFDRIFSSDSAGPVAGFLQDCLQPECVLLTEPAARLQILRA